MAEMTIDSSLLEKTAQYVNATAPIIEKTEAEKKAFADQAPELVDALVHAGLVKQANRDQAIKELIAGGLVKAAGLIQYLAGQVEAKPIGQPAKTTTKTASAGGRRESDMAFERAMLG
jgi:hypothetical protein